MKLIPYFKIIAISRLLLLSEGKIHAQASKVTVSGQVRDQASKTDLPYVNVVLKGGKAETVIAGTVTDEDGRFSFADMQPNSYIVFRDLYRLTSVTVSLLATLVVTFVMHKVLNYFTATRFTPEKP